MPSSRSAWAPSLLMPLLSIAVLALLSPCARADIANDRVSVDESDGFTIVFSFQFAAGGSFEASFALDPAASSSLPNATLQLLWATDAMVEQFRDLSFGQACGPAVFNYPTLWQTQLSVAGLRAARMNYTAPSTGWYRLLQLNCKSQSFVFEFDRVAVNPGGEYLSLSQVPFKTIGLAGSIAWAVLAAAWALNWFRYRFFNVRLQQILTAVPLSQLCLSLTGLFRWRHLSSVGRESSDLLWLSFLAAGLARGVLFLGMVLIAKGCFITRAALERREVTNIVAMIGALVLCYLAYGLWMGFLLFPLLFMYLVVLRFIFVAIAENGLALHSQIQLVREMHINPQTTPVWDKLLMFRRFQSAVVVFVCGDVVLKLWAGIFLLRLPWAGDASEAAITAALCIYVGYTFRLRPFNPYYHLLAAAPRDRDRDPHEQPNGEPDGPYSAYQEPASPSHDAAESGPAPDESGSARLIDSADSDVEAPRPPAPAPSSSAGPSSLVGRVRSLLSAVRVPHPSDGEDRELDAARAVWRPGMPLPNMELDSAPWLDQSAPGPIVLVENPPRVDSDGRLVADVVMARPVYSAPSVPAHSPQPPGPSRSLARSPPRPAPSSSAPSAAAPGSSIPLVPLRAQSPRPQSPPRSPSPVHSEPSSPSARAGSNGYSAVAREEDDPDQPANP